MTQQLDYNEALDLIDDIEQHRQSKLNNWELTFLESIRKNEGDWPQLTEKQTKCLNKIFDRVMV